MILEGGQLPEIGWVLRENSMADSTEKQGQ